MDEKVKVAMKEKTRIAALKRWSEMLPEEVDLLRQQQSAGMLRYWKGVSVKRRHEIARKIVETRKANRAAKLLEGRKR